MIAMQNFKAWLKKQGAHPFNEAELDKYATLDAYFGTLSFERNDQVLWLIKHVDNAALRDQLLYSFRDGIEHIHDVHSLHIASRTLEMKQVTGEEYTRIVAEIKPTIDKLWQKTRANVGEKLLFWFQSI